MMRRRTAGRRRIKGEGHKKRNTVRHMNSLPPNCSDLLTSSAWKVLFQQPEHSYTP
jgi:hypothetical protein